MNLLGRMWSIGESKQTFHGQMHLYHHHYVFVFIYSHIHFTLFLCCSCSHTPSVFDCNAHHATSTSFIFISSISHYYTIPIQTNCVTYSHYFVMDLKVAGLKKFVKSQLVKVDKETMSNCN
jgi:hypothetical protein